MKYLYFIFRLFFRPKCGHFWKEIDSIDVFHPEDNKETELPRYVKKESQCTKCGEFKSFKI
jgi:hypothetical protein